MATAPAWTPPGLDPPASTAPVTPGNMAQATMGGGWTPPGLDAEVPTYPVGQELGGFLKDEAKAAPRNILEGAGQLADSAGSIWDMAFHPGDESHPIFKALAKEMSDRLGLPSAEKNKLEQDTSAAVRGAAGGAVFGPVGAVSNAVSEVASRTAEQAGAGPVGQAIAGTAAGLTPTGIPSAVRGLVRGGEATAARMQENAQMFERAGANPDLAQLKAKQIATSPPEFVPGGGDRVAGSLTGAGPIKRNAAEQPRQIQETVENTAQKAAPGVPTKESLTPTTGGEALDAGFKTHRQAMAAAEDHAYQTVENLVGKDTPMEAKNFQATARTLAHPTNIPEVDAMLVGPQTNKAEAAANAATTPAQTASFSPDWQSIQSQAVPKPPLTYENLRDMRSRIGNQIDWGLSPGQPGPNGELKRLYTALGADLNAGVSKVGPMAKGAYDQANSLYKTNQAIRDRIDPLIDKGTLKGPEAIFKDATSGTKDGATRLQTFMNAVSPEQQGILKGVVLNRMGHPGGALGKVWNENTYLNNWQTLDEGAKTTLFGARGTPERQQLDAVEGVLMLRKNLGYSKSSLAEGVEQGTGKLSHIAGTGTAVIGAVGLEKFIEHIASGHTLAAAGLASGVGALTLGSNAVMSRLMTNPKILSWLTQASKAPQGMAPVLMNQLDRMGSNGADLKAVIQGNDDNGK